MDEEWKEMASNPENLLHLVIIGFECFLCVK